jgi:hypothetical protein
MPGTGAKPARGRSVALHLCLNIITEDAEQRRYLDNSETGPDALSSRTNTTSRFDATNNRSKQFLHTVAKKILKDRPMISDIFVGDWVKQETVAKTPFKAKNEPINRSVQNNNPIG